MEGLIFGILRYNFALESEWSYCNMTVNLSPTLSVRHMGPSLPYDSHERYRPSVCKGSVNPISSRNVHGAKWPDASL